MQDQTFGATLIVLIVNMETTAGGIDQSLLVDLIEEIDRDLTIRKEGHIRTKEESNFILRDLQIPLKFLTSIPRVMKVAMMMPIHLLIL